MAITYTQRLFSINDSSVGLIIALTLAYDASDVCCARRRVIQFQSSKLLPASFRPCTHYWMMSYEDSSQPSQVLRSDRLISWLTQADSHGIGTSAKTPILIDIT